jgi:hybrid cluster-associated redox disulfide protein
MTNTNKIIFGGYMKITEDMKIKEVIASHVQAAKVFKKYNLGCIGCRGADEDTIKMVATNYGLDVQQFVKDLNEAIKEAKN